MSSRSPSQTPSPQTSSYKLTCIYKTQSATQTVQTVRVLWVSRHKPLQSQIKTLEKKLGAIEVWQLVGIIPSAEFVAEKAIELGAKIVVPVLPLSFIARLVELARKHGFTVLFAKMREIHRGSREEAEKLVKEKPEWRTAVEYSGGVWRVWEFEKFEKVVKVEIVTEPW